MKDEWEYNKENQTFTAMKDVNGFKKPYFFQKGDRIQINQPLSKNIERIKKLESLILNLEQENKKFREENTIIKLREKLEIAITTLKSLREKTDFQTIDEVNSLIDVTLRELNDLL